MRPLYLKASTIGPDSPVMAEVKRIAALSADPKVRASEALRVVQSQVRYLARVDGLGNYTPESADTVWSGKSGDCKGKTVLLLAMLRALGITAEPALVSATDGDGLDASLPMPGRFNHVIARATIGDKVYWLDGARLGDLSRRGRQQDAPVAVVRHRRAARRDHAQDLGGSLQLDRSRHGLLC